MKNRSNIIALIVVLIVGVGVYFFTKDKDVATPEDEIQVPEEISSVEKNIESEDEVVSVKMKYPEISGISKIATREINSFLKKEIEQVVADFVSNSYPIAPGSAAEKNQIQSTYIVHEVFDGKISVVFDVWESYSGAAHGNPYTLSYVFNVSDGEHLLLRDFFKEDTEYLKRVSDEARILLKDPLSDWYNEAWVTTGTEPIEENFQTFFVTDTGFVFIFDPYQVAPYAAGKYQIEISKEKLKDYLK